MFLRQDASIRPSAGYGRCNLDSRFHASSSTEPRSTKGEEKKGANVRGRSLNTSPQPTACRLDSRDAALASKPPGSVRSSGGPQSGHDAITFMVPTLPPETALIMRTRDRNSGTISSRPVSTRAVQAADWMPPPDAATTIDTGSLPSNAAGAIRSGADGMAAVRYT